MRVVLMMVVAAALLGCPGPESDRRGAGPAGANVPPRATPVLASPTPEASPDEPDEPCPCDIAREEGGWCDACGKGYATGQPVACQTCAAAAADSRGGWCDEHARGYLFRKASDCQACVEAAAGVSGWCAEHRMGFLKGEKVKCQACAEGGARCEAHR